MPDPLTLEQQGYRHVDICNSSIRQLWTRFRIGYLVGRYERHAGVSLGIKAVVAAIYEPPQQCHKHRVLLEPEDPHKPALDALLDMLGMQLVGWVFTDLLPADESGEGAALRGTGDTFFLSAEEAITAGQLQVQHPNICSKAEGGRFGSKFVTCVLTGDQTNQIAPTAYQLSNQGMALVRDEILVPTFDAPELAWCRERTKDGQFAPDVFYSGTNEYGNRMKRLASRLRQGRLRARLLLPTANRFPIENRASIGGETAASSLRDALETVSGRGLAVVLSDFHLLFHLLTDPVIAFPPEQLRELLRHVMSGDSAAAEAFVNSCPNWEVVKAVAFSQSGAGWQCRHCTFQNSARRECGLRDLRPAAVMGIGKFDFAADRPLSQRAVPRAAQASTTQSRCQPGESRSFRSSIWSSVDIGGGIGSAVSSKGGEGEPSQLQHERRQILQPESLLPRCLSCQRNTPPALPLPKAESSAHGKRVCLHSNRRLNWLKVDLEAIHRKRLGPLRQAMSSRQSPVRQTSNLLPDGNRCRQPRRYSARPAAIPCRRVGQVVADWQLSQGAHLLGCAACGVALAKSVAQLVSQQAAVVGVGSGVGVTVYTVAMVTQQAVAQQRLLQQAVRRCQHQPVQRHRREAYCDGVDLAVLSRQTDGADQPRRIGRQAPVGRQQTEQPQEQQVGNSSTSRRSAAADSQSRRRSSRSVSRCRCSQRSSSSWSRQGARVGQKLDDPAADWPVVAAVAVGGFSQMRQASRRSSW
uniref:NPL4 domain-containing protein n=1 Tax=Macrostomum lignano TaxID=282301 RepID=A0A1I8FLK0_9PLAT